MINTPTCLQVGGFGVNIPNSLVIGLKKKNLSQIISDLFSNNELGFAFDFGSLTYGTYGASVLSKGVPVTIGSADASYYDVNTGVGQVYRADLDNQSTINFAVSTTTKHELVIENTGSNPININQDSATGTVLFTVPAGTRQVLVLNPMSTVVIASTNDASTATFKVHSLKEFDGDYALYQDANGVTPVIQITQPIGLALDRSKGLTLGPEIFTGFDTNLNSTRDSDTPPCTVTSTAASGTFGVSCSNIIGLKSYRVTIEWSGNTQQVPITLQLGNAYVTIGSTESGKTTCIATSTDAGSVTVYRDSTAVGQSFIVNSLTVKELAGNHAYQTTSSSRPTIGRHPKTGARNLITYSSNALDSSWEFDGVTGVGGQLDSRGMYKAVKFTGASTGVPIKKFTASITGSHTLTIRVKGVSGQSNQIKLLLRNNTTSTNFVIAGLNTDTGVITGAGWSSKAVANGYWECTYTQDTGITSGDSMQFYFGATSTTTSTFGIIVDYAQVEAGSVATAFQDTTTLQDITEVGVDSCYFAYFDGVDDFLQTSTISFNAATKFNLWSAYQRFSVGNGTFIVAELGAAFTGAGNLGMLSEATYQSIGIGSSDGYTSYRSTDSSYPYNVVAQASYDFADTTVNKVTGRLNATQDFTTLLDNTGVGATNLADNILFIGQRNGDSLPYMGNMYGMIGIARAVSGVEIYTVERGLASKSGMQL